MKTGDCIHFNGIQHEQCEAGIEYRPNIVEKPCLQSVRRPRPTANCKHFRAMTEWENAIEQKRMRDSIERIRTAAIQGKCHICGKEAEPTQRIGKCIYYACGHRGGQL